MRRVTDLTADAPARRKFGRFIKTAKEDTRRQALDVRREGGGDNDSGGNDSDDSDQLQ